MRDRFSRRETGSWAIAPDATEGQWGGLLPVAHGPAVQRQVLESGSFSKEPIGSMAFIEPERKPWRSSVTYTNPRS
jgi:hypothetical protein